MEAALDTFARRLGVDSDEDRRLHQVELRFPFDPRTRRMAVAGDDVVMGDPDASRRAVWGRPRAHARVDAMTVRGLRVLASCCGPARGALSRGRWRRPPRPALVGLVAPGPAARRRHRGPHRLPDGGDQRGDGDRRPPATAAAIADEVGLLPDSRADRVPPRPTTRSWPRSSTTTAWSSRGWRPRTSCGSPRPCAPRPRGRDDRRRGERRPALQEATSGWRWASPGPTSPVGPRTSCSSTTTSRPSSPGRAGARHVLNMRRFLTYHLTDNVAELTPFLVWVLSGGTFPRPRRDPDPRPGPGHGHPFGRALGAEPGSGTCWKVRPGGGAMNGTVLRRAFGLLGAAGGRPLHGRVPGVPGGRRLAARRGVPDRARPLAVPPERPSSRWSSPRRRSVRLPRTVRLAVDAGLGDEPAADPGGSGWVRRSR